MGSLLTTARGATGAFMRFDPAYWTVNFPRPMMAAVTSTAVDALRVDCVFYQTNDLAGLIWASEDTIDHPLMRYDTARDYRLCKLAFHWRSAGIIALDALNGPTLTIEGRDASGAPRAWYVRLWNYATGTSTDAAIAIDFGALDGGFYLPGNADPVWAGDIDRMFISLVPPGYTGAAGSLAAPSEGWAEMTGIACTGAGAALTIGNTAVPETGLSIASGYDDSYNLTPERMLSNAFALGYRGRLIHYVGMSHYFRLEANSGGLYASLAGGVLNVACAAWHRDFARRAHVLGFEIVWSVSYELFNANCWGDWGQRASDGSPALTGWVPPSTVLSPANPNAMSYLHQVATAFVAIGVAAGMPPRFQVGEPWWWLTAAGQPCFYDAASVAAFAPVPIATVRGPLTASQLATLDAAGACLAASTHALVAAVKAAAPQCVTYILLYLPTLLDARAPELRRALLPTAWASPAFDVLQIEDYDWVTGGDTASTAAGVATMTARLGYAPAAQDYLSGFVATAPAAATDWPLIDTAAETAQARGVARAFIWALPQVMRDGFVHLPTPIAATSSPGRKKPIAAPLFGDPIGKLDPPPVIGGDRDDRVTLTLGGAIFAGWTSVEVAIGIDAVAASFTLGVTDRWPGHPEAWAFDIDAAATVRIGNQIVVAGFTDRLDASLDGDRHSITLGGRSAVGDLVDCAALNAPGTWRNQRLETIAAEIAAPFGVKINTEADTSPAFKLFALQPGETAFDAIGRMLKQRGLYGISAPDGRLRIVAPKPGAASVTLTQGVELMALSGSHDVSERFSKVIAKGQAAGDDQANGASVAAPKASANDPAVRRYRPLVVIAEDQATPASLAKRAQWEVSVRAAKAQTARVSVPGWRQASGALWQPMQLVTLNAPAIWMTSPMMVAACTFRLDEGGRRTDLTLGRPEAYTQLPVPDDAKAASIVKQRSPSLARSA